MNLSLDQLAYNDYWYFVSERHKIYLKRNAGEPKPWSDDPIFQHWKFCNVFRKLDKTSFWLWDNVLRHKMSPELIVFNIFLFRAFNRIDTYDYLRRNRAFLTSWNKDLIKDLLYVYLSEGGQLSSGAYMLRGREGMPKYESIIETLDKVWHQKEELTDQIMINRTIRESQRAILSQDFWGWGEFTSYQVVLDLTYTPILEDASDINEWCAFGPGAKKGLRLIWPGLKLEEPWMLAAAQYLRADQIKYRDPHVPEMSLQDVEYVCCELQKFERIKHGGRGKERYDGA